MPKENDKDLLVILDNLEQFAEKLLLHIADDSAAGSQKLIEILQHASARYNKPIDAYITGWFYYLSRARGPEVHEVIAHIQVESSALERLKLFKSLVQKGQWKVGSFNNFLFLELVHTIPGYEPLNDNAVEPVIARLNVLLNRKIHEYITQFEANQRMVAEREQNRSLLLQKAQSLLLPVVIQSDRAAVALNAKQQSTTIHFYLAKEGAAWCLSWINSRGVEFVLPLNEELLNILNSQLIESVDQLSVGAMKRVQKHCMLVRQQHCAKIRVLINPTDAHSKANLTDEALCAQGHTASFVLRGTEKTFSLSWINTLGKATQFSLESVPQLRDWLAMQEHIADEQKIELSAYLSQVNTVQNIGMHEFKLQLQNCLTHRAVAANQVPKKIPQRLNLGLFKEVERCINQQVGQIQGAVAELRSEKVSQAAPVKKLNLSQYAAISALFVPIANKHGLEEEVPLCTLNSVKVIEHYF